MLSLVGRNTFFANYDKKPRKLSFRAQHLVAVSKDAELNFKFLLGIYSQRVCDDIRIVYSQTRSSVPVANKLMNSLIEK